LVCGKSRARTRRDGCQLTASLLNGDAVSQPCDHLIVPHLTALAAIDRCLPERQPQVRVRWKLHALRHHTHDGGRKIVDFDGFPEDTLVAGISGLPDVESENDDGRGAVEIVLCNESAAEDSLGTNQTECVRRDVSAVVAFRRCALLADVERRLTHQRDVRKAFRRLPYIEEVVVRHAESPAARVLRT
jgi:hypothetical protein